MLHSHPIATLVLSGLTFASYVWLSLIEPTSQNLTIFKDIGMGGAFIASCFFMFRYFTSQIEKKDQHQRELTDRFLKAIEERSKADAEVKEHLIHLTEKIEKCHLIDLTRK